MEVRVGRDFKLEAADPYLFYIYEFRRFSLLARLIVAIGYGFGDSHINKILSQALTDDASRKLLVVSNCANDDAQKHKEDELKELLRVQDSQVKVQNGTAKAFLEGVDLHKDLLAFVPPPAGSPF
jgi:hypothetical protein